MKKTIAVITVLFLILALMPASSFAEDEIPVISHDPQNLRWPEGADAYYQCKAENDPGHEKFLYEWYIIYENVVYKATGYSMSDPWVSQCDPSKGMGVGGIGNTFFLSGIKSGLDGAEIYCIVKSGDGKYFEESAHAVIMVGYPDMFTPPEISVPHMVTCRQDEYVELYCEARCTSGNVSEKGDNLEYLWYETASGNLFDIIAVDRGAEDSPIFVPDTSVPGWYYYVCGVTDRADDALTNVSYSSVITLVVSDRETVTGIGISRLPDKMEYQDGEKIDLTGLEVSVATNYGYYELDEGDAKKVSPDTAKYTAGGIMTVKVSFDEGDVTFDVAVLKESGTKPSGTDGTDTKPGGTAEPDGKSTPIPWYIFVIGGMALIILILLIILLTRKKKDKQEKK